MLIGKWENIEHIEAKLTLPELEAIVTAAREQEMRNNRFMAALKGIDLDEDKDKVSRFDEIKARVDSKIAGKSVDAMEWDDMGIEIEEE